jgi:CRP-like cAMP-binding protein
MDEDRFHGHDPRTNTLLRLLGAKELEHIVEHLEYHEGRVRDLVFEAGQPIEHVYFPLTAVFSQVALTEGGRIAVEVNTVGSEGMIGLQVFLGTTMSPNTAFCQIGGAALRMPSEVFLDVLAEAGTFQHHLSRYTQATMVFLSQSVACNRSHSIEQRASRWLLLTGDRVHRDEFELTQEFLAQMLGVGRARVSTIASRLQRLGLITYRRGRISIADRPGLEHLACDCYAIVRAEFDRLLDWNHGAEEAGDA